MYEFNSGDSKWDLLKKILLNQVSIATATASQLAAVQTAIVDRLTNVFDRLWQINQSLSPSQSFTSIGDLVVTSAGTAVQGPDRPTPNGVLVVARLGNTGSVYVGGSGVTNIGGSQRGIELVQAGMSSTVLRIANTNLLWVNADNNNDAVGIIIL